MTDIDLLKSAANAIALEWVNCGKVDGSGDLISLETCKVWNPLKDDGDAFRLAVKLGISFGVSGKYVGARWQPQGNAYLEPTGIPCFEIGEDPYAATRRAIVLAAVEIGKQ